MKNKLVRGSWKSEPVYDQYELFFFLAIVSQLNQFSVAHELFLTAKNNNVAQ